MAEFSPSQQTWLERYIRLIARQKPAYEVSTDGLLLQGATIIQSGAGTPESVVTAPPGSLFLRTDGGATTSLYVKTSGTGNTG